MEIQFRITKIVLFRYPRWLQWQPSWNSSNNISSQTISQNELKLDGRHQRFRFAKIVPFRFPRWLPWGPSLNSSNAISSETISQIELKLDGRHRNKDIQSALVAQLDATGDQEVAGSTPAEVGNILWWRLITKYFLRSFSPFSWFKKGSCQFLAKECAQYWLTA